MLVTFAVLTFVRTPYIYATRGGPFARTLNVGSAVWFVLLGLILFGPSEYSRMLAIASLVYPAMYLGLSAVVTVQRHLRS
jgi:hypothetical protein